MIKIAHVREALVLKDLPAEVVAKVVEIATVLDDSYGDERDVVRELGGYILIAEDARDIDAIALKLEFVQHPPEYVDLVDCSTGENYTSSLILLSSDYSISLIIPISLTPQSLLNHMDERV